MRSILSLFLLLCVVVLPVYSQRKYPAPKSLKELRSEEDDISARTDFNFLDYVVARIYINNTYTVNGTQAYPEIQRSTFYPRVDEFAVLTIPSSWNTTQKNPYLQVFFEINGNFLHPKFYYNATAGGTVGFWSVVATLSNSKLTGMRWVEDCTRCENAGQCTQGTCATPQKECENANVTDCNIKVYLGWEGTTLDTTSEITRTCVSVNSIPQSFDKWSYYPIYNIGKNLFNDFVSRIFSTNPPPGVSTDDDADQGK